MSCNRGFTLVEALFALALWMVVASLVTTIIHTWINLENRIEAYELAHALKEAIHNEKNGTIAHEEIMTSYGIFEVQVGDDQKVCVKRSSESVEDREVCLELLEQ